MDNKEFESLRKYAELKKLNKEIAKIEAETEEIISRKNSAWAPMIGSLIIGAATLGITYGTGFFDGKLALVEAETLVIQVKKDSLSRRIDSLQSIYRKDSINFLARIKNQDMQLDSLSQKFLQDKRKFDNERAKYGYVISQKEKEIGGLISENKKIEECIIKAKEFLKYCVRYDEYEPGMHNSDSLIRGYNPPYRTRFNKSLEEISKIDIQKMDYSQFLQFTANFTIDNSGNSGNVVLVSTDKKIRVILYPIYGNYKKIVMGRIHETQLQFECYKSLSNNQKLKLLKQMIIRPY